MAVAAKWECEHEVPVGYMLPQVGKSFGLCGEVECEHEVRVSGKKSLALRNLSGV